MASKVAVFTACVALSVTPLRAEPERAPSLLLGPAPPAMRVKPKLHPALPAGAERHSVARPTLPEDSRLCSQRHPVCVHADAQQSFETTAEALSAFESAYERLVLALRLPAPLPDDGRGGSDALDLYLPNDATQFRSAFDRHEGGHWDRASAFCIAPAGETIQRDAALCLGEAIAWRLDAAETPHARRAYATHLWWIVGHPTDLDVEAIDAVQQSPHEPIAARDNNRFSEGDALWFEYLDEHRGQGTSGRLATGLLALGVERTPPGALRWSNEPDHVDVLRHSLDEGRARTAGLFGHFAAQRAFVGSRDDGTHLPALGFAGDFGRVRFDWVIELDSLPRRVAPILPISSTGSLYVWLDLDKAPKDLTLGFQAEWEAPVSFVWSLIRVDAKGRELGRVDVPYREQATLVEQRVVDFEGAAGLVIVGTNLGGVDLAHPFDPDHAPFEPHGCTVYLAKL